MQFVNLRGKKSRKSVRNTQVAQPQKAAGSDPVKFWGAWVKRVAASEHRSARGNLQFSNKKFCSHLVLLNCQNCSHFTFLITPFTHALSFQTKATHNVFQSVFFEKQS